MSRVAAAALAAMFASASATQAATPTQKPAVTKKKRTKAKRKLVTKRRSKHQPTKTQVAANGRVIYGRDNMPPGYSWPPNPAMKAAGRACEHDLDNFGLGWEPAPREGKITDPIVVPEMTIAGIKYVSVYKKPPHTMDCQLAHVLGELGPELRKLGVREVRFGSIYRNTPVRAHGVTRHVLSRHALGLAMDIKAFVDESGRVANVELDYLKGDALLHGIEDLVNRSNKFRIVLTPGNDPISHYDHFHVEASVDFTAFR